VLVVVNADVYTIEPLSTADKEDQVIRRFAEYFVIAWLSLPVTLLAQGTPGSIQGLVCEVKTCKPIDGVQVYLVP